MKKLFKNYKPYKSVIYLYFCIPLILNAVINYSNNEDIWYMMKYGEHILRSGFIHTDVLSMHSNLHIVIQQSFTNVIYYILYHFMGSFGLFLLLEGLIILYLYFLYKLCMKLSNNKLVSSILSIITVLLLQLNFITPRSQIFTYLFVIILLYIMEEFYKNNNTKLIFFLPVLSLLQINLHGALWYILFIMLLPYIVQLIIDKNKNVFKIMGLSIIMFLVGFINPYTYENVFFPFTCYSPYMNTFIAELKPVNIFDSSTSVSLVSYIFYFLLSIILLIYIYYKKGKLEIRHLLLLGGSTFMALANLRSIAFFIIASIPMLANYLKDVKIDVIEGNNSNKKVWLFIIGIIICTSILNNDRLVSNVNGGARYLKKHYGTNIVLYSGLDYGSYLEYLGFHPYFDTRAEAFLKKTNKKEDIFREQMMVQDGIVDYDKFIDKYKFTHFVVYNKSYLNYYLKKNSSYKVIYKKKKYTIYIKVS